VNKQLFRSALIIAKLQFKLRVEGSYLGVLWYLLEPLIIFAILLSIRDIVSVGVEHYPAYLISGLVIFNFFRKATLASANCINSNSSLITGLNTRPAVFVLSSFFMGALIHAFEVTIMAGVLLFTGLPVGYVFLYPIVFIVFAPFVLGTSFFLAAAGAYVNDIDNVWSVLTRLLWFATPVFYTARLKLPFNFNAVNPMCHFITFAREIIIYHRMPGIESFAYAGFFSLSVLFTGYMIFRKLEANFSEQI
jgi:ABC-type polysaccharide/polyol phosphate export permease